MPGPWSRNRNLQCHEAVARINHGCFVDIHCHCLPGVDDGPQTMEESVELCRALVRDGVKTVTATPHQLGPWTTPLDGPATRDAVAGLNSELKARDVGIEVLSGCEIRVDVNIPELLRADRLMSMADNHEFVLLELPFDSFVDIASLIAELSEMAIQSVIAHPERNAGIRGNPRLVHNWKDWDPTFQITATSLAGGFGRQVERTAWRLLDMPIKAVVATDAHNASSRFPELSKAFDLLVRRQGPVRARDLCVDGPLELIGRAGSLKGSVPSSQMDF